VLGEVHGLGAPRQEQQAPPHHARLGGEALRTGDRDYPRRHGAVRLQLVVNGSTSDEPAGRELAELQQNDC
jgi:hypothetical protein